MVYMNSTFYLLSEIYSIISSALFLIFGFVIIKISDYTNLYDTFESSPLFNFYLGENYCYNKVNFHTWEGIKIKSGNIEIPFYKQDINKISGKYFCYKKIKYKDLLYNGQIVKNNEQCKDHYTSCGIIDTLNQKLCIRKGEECPLYDISINGTGIYYNNKNGNTIIGKLILNHDQPCYYLSDKLWRKFYSEEAGEDHIYCQNEVFGKIKDTRYEFRGSVEYKKLYQDNLIFYSSKIDYKNLILQNIKDEKVSLYKREFLGIDKECELKNPAADKNYTSLKENQGYFKYLIIIEAFILLLFSISIFKDICYLEVLFSLRMLALILSIIFGIKFIINILNNNISTYNCSDSITNEILRIENRKMKISLACYFINIICNIVLFVFHIFGEINICKDCLKENKKIVNKIETKEIENKEIENNNPINGSGINDTSMNSSLKESVEEENNELK